MVISPRFSKAEEFVILWFFERSKWSIKILIEFTIPESLTEENQLKIFVEVKF